MFFGINYRELFNDLPNELALCGINEDQLSIMRNNMADAKQRWEIQSHTDMKAPMIIGTRFEEFDLAFTAAVRTHNALNVIPLDYLLRTYRVENYDGAWNACE